MGDGRWNGSVQGVVAQHLLDGFKFANRFLLRLLRANGLLLLFGLLVDGNFFRRIHKTTSSGFLEKDGKGLASAVELATNSIGGLIREGGDLVVTHLLISHEEQEQAILGR